MQINYKNYTFVQDITFALFDSGYECYIVGGAVRDTIMQRPVKDIDLTTNATPTQVSNVFSGNYLVIPVGIEFGTLRVCDKSYPHNHVEITTYRKDIVCTGRHAKVLFSNSVLDDVQRRDFTINGLLFNPNTLEVIDLVNGQTDVNNNIIRTIGNPEDRLKEDYLRMLRACRFMALNEKMVMESGTFDAIKKNAHMIHETLEGKLTTDRQREELLKGMGYPYPSRMIEAMRQTGLLHYVLPELKATIGVTQNSYHNLYICNECEDVLVRSPEDQNTEEALLYRTISCKK